MTPPSPPVREHLRWALTCLVFGALPFWLIAFGLGQAWGQREEAVLARAFRGLDTVLEMLQRDSDSGEYLVRLLSRIDGQARAAREPMAEVGRGCAALRLRLPGLLRIAVTDGSGECQPQLCDGAPPRKVLRRLHAALANRGQSRMQVAADLRRDWPLLRTFLGPQASPDNFQHTAREAMEVSARQEGRYFCYLVTPRLGLFVHANGGADWQLAGLRDRCRAWRAWRRDPGIAVGVLHLGDPATPPADLALALGALRDSGAAHHRGRGRLLALLEVAPTAWLWAARPDADAPGCDSRRLALVGAGTVLFALFALFTHGVMVGGRARRFPIRLRLVVLFVFASGLPLAVMLILGWNFVQARYVARVREAHDRSERRLFAFDARFPQMRGRIELQVTRAARILPHDGQGGPVLEELCRRFARHYRCSDLGVYDLRGRAVFDALPNASEKGVRGRKVMGSLVRAVLARLRGEDPPIDTTLQMLETVTPDIVESFTRSVGQVMQVTLRDDVSWSMMLPLPGPDGEPAMMLQFHWNKLALEQLFLRATLPAAQRADEGLRLYAARNGSSEGVPASFPWRPALGRLIQRVELRRATVTDRLALRGAGVQLVTGIKPKHLNHHLLLAVQPERPIRAELAVLQRSIVGFLAFTVAVSVFLGTILSANFLGPIQGLGEGVAAIEARRFQHRVPLGGLDELGDLSRTFNRVLEGLSDLEVARIVQESLLPADGLVAGDYSIHGVNLAASELGGDYFDLVTLADGRVLIVIGDVTGHGVPAALVMAMAKGLVTRESEVDPRPETVLDVLNRVLERTLRRQKMMSCFLVLLDPAQHVLRCANAGHNFPWLVRAGGGVEFVELRGFPLGASTRRPYRGLDLTLAPGDGLLLYTDGLVEARAGGEMLGYDRVGAALPGLFGADPRQSCTRLLAWHRALTGDGPQEDDITLVALHRRAG